MIGKKADYSPTENAEVIRRRYDFDFAPKPSASAQNAPATAADQAAVSQPAATPAPRREPEGPRPSLLQTLTSEASIKIYLYLGAFFVIACGRYRWRGHP